MQRMKTVITCAIVAATIPVWSSTAISVDPPASKRNGDGATKMEELAWLAGSWHGTFGDSRIEETWTAPSNGALLGMSRMGGGRGAATYEILLIEQEGEDVMLRLKLFGPRLHDRNGKVIEMKQTRSGERDATFEGVQDGRPERLRYWINEQDELQARLEKQKPDGKPMVLDFRMKRVR